MTDIAVKLQDDTYLYQSFLSELPNNFENNAIEINENLQTGEGKITVVADTNYKDLDELIPKFTVTSDIVDSLIADAADDLKKVRDENYDDLDSLPARFDSVESDSRATLKGYLDDVKPVRDENYSLVGAIPNEIKGITDKSNATLEGLFGERK